MGLFTTKNKNRWEITDFDETHIVEINMGATIRDPIQIFIDGNHTETVTYSGRTFMPFMEYKFRCGNETLLMVLYGNTIEVVRRGRIVSSNLEYNRENKLSIAVIVLLAILSFAAISEFWLLTPIFGPIEHARSVSIAIAMIAMSFFISWSKASSPFLSKKKRVWHSIFFVLWAWFLTAFIVIFL